MNSVFLSSTLQSPSTQLPFELKWSSKFQKHELMGRNFEVVLVPKSGRYSKLKVELKLTHRRTE